MNQYAKLSALQDAYLAGYMHARHDDTDMLNACPSLNALLDDDTSHGNDMRDTYRSGMQDGRAIRAGQITIH